MEQIELMIFYAKCHFQKYFRYIMATSFSGGRSKVNKANSMQILKGSLLKVVYTGLNQMKLA
jgi:hypothetical protein